MSLASVLVSTDGLQLEESGLFLDLLVSCICVMNFVINRKTLCSDQSLYFDLPQAKATAALLWALTERITLSTNQVH